MEGYRDMENISGLPHLLVLTLHGENGKGYNKSVDAFMEFRRSCPAEAIVHAYNDSTGYPVWIVCYYVDNLYITETDLNRFTDLLIKHNVTMPASSYESRYNLFDVAMDNYLLYND